MDTHRIGLSCCSISEPNGGVQRRQGLLEYLGFSRVIPRQTRALRKEHFAQHSLSARLCTWPARPRSLDGLQRGSRGLSVLGKLFEREGLHPQGPPWGRVTGVTFGGFHGSRAEH